MIKSIKTFWTENFLNDSAFRVAYFISLFFCGVAFIDIGAAITCAFLMVWSIFILYDKYKKQNLGVRYFKLIFLFIVFSLVTAVINIKMGFAWNFFTGLIMIYHSIICFFIFYGTYNGNEFSKLKKESMLVFKTIVVLTTSITLLSLIFIVFKDSVTIVWDMPIVEKYERVLGIVKSENSARLTGFYINPNIMAFCSVVSTIFCHILYRKNELFGVRRRGMKFILMGLLVAINLIAIVLSDSIASFLFLSIYAFLWLFYRLMIENKNIPGKVLLWRSIVFLLCCVILIFGLFAARSNFQSGVSDMIDEVYSTISHSTENVNVDEDIRFGRPNHNILEGSGRRRLLKQAMVIFSKHPIFGIGNTNIVDYGKIYFESGIAFPNFHNGYVSILVCNGLVGFVLFMAFLGLVMFRLIQFLRLEKTREKGNVFANLLVANVAYLVFAMFEKTMLSEINFMGIFFWLILGYAVAYANEHGFFEKKESKNLK